jgi:hypothetical protein
MASGITNRGKLRILEWAFRDVSVPTNFYVALCTDANTPDQDTNVLSDLTEINTGNNYNAGGYQLAPGVTDFDVASEDDSGDLAYVQIKDVAWAASGGPIPASGSDARWAVLTDDASDGEVIAWFDLTSGRSVSDGQTLTLQDCECSLEQT